MNYNKINSVYVAIIVLLSSASAVNAMENECTIFEAVGRGKIDEVKNILKKDPQQIFCNENLAELKDATPLKLAIKYNQLAVAKLLVQYGAADDKNGMHYLNQKIETTQWNIKNEPAKRDYCLELLPKLQDLQLTALTTITALTTNLALPYLQLQRITDNNQLRPWQAKLEFLKSLGRW